MILTNDLDLIFNELLQESEKTGMYINKKYDIYDMMKSSDEDDIEDPYLYK